MPSLLSLNAVPILGGYLLCLKAASFTYIIEVVASYGTSLAARNIYWPHAFRDFT